MVGVGTPEVALFFFFSNLFMLPCLHAYFHSSSILLLSSRREKKRRLSSAAAARRGRASWGSALPVWLERRRARLRREAGMYSMPEWRRPKETKCDVPSVSRARPPFSSRHHPGSSRTNSTGPHMHLRIDVHGQGA